MQNRINTPQTHSVLKQEAIKRIVCNPECGDDPGHKTLLYWGYDHAEELSVLTCCWETEEREEPESPVRISQCKHTPQPHV
ncbi:uncharacterized [Tachysurus ichikawai]